MTKKNTTLADAERAVADEIKYIEEQRKRNEISMRSLSAAAGLRPTSYWGIVRTSKNMRNVKASTLAALRVALYQLTTR